MNSLSSRLLVSVSVLLLFFFGATIAVLDRAFTEAGEQARQDILDGHLVGLLAAAEPDDTGRAGNAGPTARAAFGTYWLRTVRRDARR